MAFVRVTCLRVLRVVCCVMLYGFSVLLFFVCVGDLLTCLCDVFMTYCVLSYGLWLCCCACVRVRVNVFVRFVCGLSFDVA